MPAAVNANLRAPSIPPSLAAAVRYVRDARGALERLNGEATDITRGHIRGATTALSYLLEGVAEESAAPTRRRVVIPAATLTGIALIRDRRHALEKQASTDETEGEIVGLTEALALILEAAADEADNPANPL